MKMEKSDSATWQTYIFEQSEDNDEIKSKLGEFVEYLIGETNEALRMSEELDEERYSLEDAGRWVKVSAKGWVMDSEDEVVRVRDALREVGVGDESVGVYCSPRSVKKGGPAPLPPIVEEYDVLVQLHREVELFDGAVGQASEKNE